MIENVLRRDSLSMKFKWLAQSTEIAIGSLWKPLEDENCCIPLYKLCPCDAHNGTTQNPEFRFFIESFAWFRRVDGAAGRGKSCRSFSAFRWEVLECWQKISAISWHSDNSTLPTIFIAIKLTSMKSSFVSPHKKNEREGKIFVAVALKHPSIRDCVNDFFLENCFDAFVGRLAPSFLYHEIFAWGFAGSFRHARKIALDSRSLSRLYNFTAGRGAGDRRGGWRNLCSVASRCQAYTDVTRFRREKGNLLINYLSRISL